jgi:hypothetical protein
MLWQQFIHALSNNHRIVSSSTELLQLLPYVIHFRLDDLNDSLIDYCQTIISNFHNHWIAVSCVIYTHLLTRHKQLWGCFIRNILGTIAVWITTTLQVTEVGFGL